MKEKVLKLLFKNTIIGLTFFFCIGVLILLVNFQLVADKLIETQAINNVKNTAQVLKKARNFYITNLKKLQNLNNLEVTNNSSFEASQIPLPATFLKELGNQISQDHEGMEVKLYSNYPFPWHKQEEKERDDFEQKAIEFLPENPDKSFYRFEKLGNNPVIRYAEADIMQISCVECHNHYPGTPKTDWKVGDVCGVLEITQSLKDIKIQFFENTKETLLILVSLSLIGITGLGLSIRRLDEYSSSLKNQVEVRQEAIEQAFTEIHNGPLQNLAILLREIQASDNPAKSLFPRLKALDNEIRAVGDQLIDNSKSDNLNEFLATIKMRLGEGSILNLNHPLDELLYEVFILTLERDFPHFLTLKITIVDFTPLNETSFDMDIKRELCYYLEEALCNVGKHAQGVTRITVIGEKLAGFYTLKVQDNGSGLVVDTANKGTKNAEKLAKKLKGKFTRETLTEGGVVCCLSWKL